MKMTENTTQILNRNVKLKDDLKIGFGKILGCIWDGFQTVWNVFWALFGDSWASLGRSKSTFLQIMGETWTPGSLLERFRMDFGWFCINVEQVWGSFLENLGVLICESGLDSSLSAHCWLLLFQLLILLPSLWANDIHHTSSWCPCAPHPSVFPASNMQKSNFWNSKLYFS